MMFFVASDHRGLALKEYVVEHLRSRGITVTDMGPQKRNEDDAYPVKPPSVDYPDYAGLVAKEVQAKVISEPETDAFGILICGTGIGMSIAANKFHGVRAARCLTVEDVRLARAHNNANVLCLASNRETITSAAQFAEADTRVKHMVDEFIVQRCEGGRHQTRIDKIAKLGI